MSHHQDTLVAYVKYFAKVDEDVGSARMTAIDSKSMTIEYVSSGKTQQTSIIFDPPIEVYDEVKPRLIAMREEALEGVGMVNRPVISVYQVPPLKLAAITSSLMLALIYTTLAGEGSLGSQLRTLVGGPPAMKWIWGLTGLIHSAEGLYMTSLCKRHKTGIRVGALWVLSAVSIGFPFIVQFRKIVQQERIASIRKTT
ncbi:hypothetical protein RSOLAG1IB_06105 [Rhizoctonia solani AG-1 IB]|uniref:DUF2470 domain-containing protein n=1 Tax=Thanatephorus cucumeris (strain AG1-IB / isolate 7/3/14) TaxID=1108050 RepID=A0A0B7F9Z7_THACB|nr:hypothetical protein RSOLAG1IB_06105 [Rhizoctonia solani AG-1 IB]